MRTRFLTLSSLQLASLQLASLLLGCTGSSSADTGTQAGSEATSEGESGSSSGATISGGSATATGSSASESATSSAGESTSGTTGGATTTSTSTSTSTSATTTGVTQTTATTSEETGTTAPADSDTGEATTEPGCTAVPVEVVENLALTGPDFCGDVNDDRVFQEQTDLDTWFSEVCLPLEQCLDIDCPPQPAIDWNTSTLLMGDAEYGSACGGFFEWEVLDCGDQVQAHYTYRAYGPCEAYIAQYETVRMPKLDAPIILTGETLWTLEKP